MDALLNILPEAILYFASGFLFVCGYYFLIDRRFDFFSEISLSIMLVIGFAITNLLRAIPKPFHFPNMFCRNICILAISFGVGFILAFIRNKLGPYMSRFLISLSEEKENPYLLLGRYIKYDLKGNVIDTENSDKDNVQMIIRPDNFDEVVLIYDQNSSKCVHLDII